MFWHFVAGVAVGLTIPPPGSPRSALNAARSSYRRQAVRPEELVADAWLLAQPDEGADTAREALAAVEAVRVREALSRLPAPQLEAITLIDLGGYTAAQTAQIVGAPRGTILSRVHRGRKVLARSLAPGQDWRG